MLACLFFDVLTLVRFRRLSSHRREALRDDAYLFGMLESEMVVTLLPVGTVLSAILTNIGTCTVVRPVPYRTPYCRYGRYCILWRRAVQRALQTREYGNVGHQYVTVRISLFLSVLFWTVKKVDFRLCCASVFHSHSAHGCVRHVTDCIVHEER